MKTYYAIVPINDGYNYVCKNPNGLHFLKSKEDRFINNSLIFESSIDAAAYILDNLDADKYKFEKWKLSEKEVH